MISKRPPRASLNNTPIRLSIASDGPIGNRKMPRIGSTPNRGTIGAKTSPRNASDLHLRLCRRGPFSQDGAPVLVRTGPFSQDGARGRVRGLAGVSWNCVFRTYFEKLLCSPGIKLNWSFSKFRLSPRPNFEKLLCRLVVWRNWSFSEQVSSKQF